MLKYAIAQLIKGENLAEEEASSAMEIIMDGQATPAQIAGFITALRMKGETIEEITGCAKVMRKKAQNIFPKLDYYIDTCGTGGDGAHTFNISTAAAFVAAAGGVPVAKHGNRSVSSKSGSADVLEALGVNIELSPEEVKECIEHVGIGFMFAPAFHKSMKYAAAPRKELGIRTIFNILGPLTNPAAAKGQILGVFDAQLVRPLALVLRNLGVERAMVVHGADGLDEITLTGETLVCELDENDIKEYRIDPRDYGFNLCSHQDLQGGDAQTNAKIILDVLNNQQGYALDVVILNSAAALYIGKKVQSLQEGIAKAREIIESGKAMEKLQQLIRFTKE
ncbi:MAG: anthranilate phosphoribosyltransferase [Petroclostridium sp.]|jgi:anthranilate phosphoribosyltransferase|uniref:anthranilate phosphoribosyltransferase n=1 Tax=Petroclostridium xylanilyticum TaxID=1792311 RepID=UPI000B996348|nr:anthranilate phosphoribosyltransferase [Petroclostridium xylanilyticum]MBZ4644790.1 trpD [Clostridia bacterium]MDK2810886.1 anthranilate phosphoribosyltransferase [Petroclostridium sp.]